MTLAIAKTKRDGFLRKIDALQRRLAALHQKALDDLIASAVNTLSRAGGIAHWSPTPVRLRTMQLRADIERLMDGAFSELVRDGHNAAAAVLKAAEKRKREDRMDDDALAAALLFLNRDPAKHFDSLLKSKNMIGLSWQEQVGKSFARTVNPTVIADELERGVAEGDAKAMRARVLPYLETTALAMQTIAQCEGIRLAQTAQQDAYLQADRASVRGTGLLAGQTLHCACIPTSAEDHVARHLKYYHRFGVGEYFADDGERMPRPPYGHPNCLCWLVPDLA